MNDKGVMELPVKLLIMMLMIGLVIPSVTIGYRGVSRMRFENRIRSELKDVIAFSRKLVQEGDLASMSIELDLKGDIFASIDHVDVGGTLGDMDWMIQYRFSWKGSEEYLTAVDPVIHMTSPDNNTYRLTGGIHQLKLTHVLTEEDSFIVVSDINTDIDCSKFT